jgi:NADPH:quinone reductase-like Zn-dependent oxidoreductase
LIQVSSCGISPIDRRVVAGDLAEFKPPSRIIGYEVSGTIEKLGNTVKGLAVGEEVVAALPLDFGGGFAEYVAVSSDYVGPY